MESTQVSAASLAERSVVSRKEMAVNKSAAASSTSWSADKAAFLN